MILTPDGLAPEINRTGGASGSACPRDPFHYQRGEPGYYADTQLGEVPNDFQLAPVYGYTPVHEGWTMTNQGFIPGGLTLGDSAPPQRARLIGLGTPSEDDYRRWSFAIQVATGAAIIASAAFGIRRALRDEAASKAARRRR